MTATFRTIRIPTGFVIGALVAIVALQAFGQVGRVSPPLVATVNLAEVLEGLNERADAEAKLRGIAEEIRAVQEGREAEIKQMQAQLENVVGGDERVALEEKIALETLEYQAWLRFANDKLDVERSLLLQSLYRAIKDAVAEMAETEDLDLVIIDDSRNDLGVNPELRTTREAQIRQQITSRRVIYSDTSMNLTEDLIARMNNAYNAGAVGR